MKNTIILLLFVFGISSFAGAQVVRHNNHKRKHAKFHKPRKNEPHPSGNNPPMS